MCLLPPPRPLARCRDAVVGVVQALVAFAVLTAVFLVGGYAAKAQQVRQDDPDLPLAAVMLRSEFWVRDDTWVLWGLISVLALVMLVVGLAAVAMALRWGGRHARNGVCWLLCCGCLARPTVKPV